MRLAGDLADFSLPDLIQVHALAGKTCAIMVTGPEGGGAIFLEDGGARHATFGALQGEDALVALLVRPIGYFEVRPDAESPARTLTLPLSRLLLTASERISRGDVPAIEQRVRLARVVEPARAVEPAPARTPRKRWLLTAAAVLFGVVGTLALSQSSRRSTSSPLLAEADAGSVRSEAGRVIDARELTGPGDAPPVLLDGELPASPDPDFALDPTVVCRLLIDPDGQVTEAKIYRSRIELALFEEEALRAVRRFRFQPARRADSPVPVWTNWSVTFRQP